MSHLSDTLVTYVHTKTHLNTHKSNLTLLDVLTAPTVYAGLRDIHTTEQSATAYLNRLWFSGVDLQNFVILLGVEGDSLYVVKDVEKVSLDGVGVTGLTKDLQKSSVRDKEEPREDQSLLLQVPAEGLLTEFQLLQEVGQELAQCLVTHAALHHVGHLVGTGHDLLPGLVNVTEPFGFL